MRFIGSYCIGLTYLWGAEATAGTAVLDDGFLKIARGQCSIGIPVGMLKTNLPISIDIYERVDRRVFSRADRLNYILWLTNSAVVPDWVVAEFANSLACADPSPHLITHTAECADGAYSTFLVEQPGLTEAWSLNHVFDQEEADECVRVSQFISRLNESATRQVIHVQADEAERILSGQYRRRDLDSINPNVFHNYVVEYKNSDCRIVFFDDPRQHNVQFRDIRQDNVPPRFIDEFQYNPEGRATFGNCIDSNESRKRKREDESSPVTPGTVYCSSRLFTGNYSLLYAAYRSDRVSGYSEDAQRALCRELLVRWRQLRPEKRWGYIPEDYRVGIYEDEWMLGNNDYPLFART